MSDAPRVTMFICRSAREALQTQEGELALPEGVGVVELPCSGRIDPVTIIRALRSGSWAVMVVGCLEDNCKFQSGNYQARRAVEEVRSILEQVRVDPQRVQMFNVASNQHAGMAAAVDEMTERARRLGPVSILEGDR